MCRVSSTEDEAASEISSSLDMAPLEEVSPSMQIADTRPVSCKLEAKGGISLLDQSMGWKVNNCACTLFIMYKLIASSYVLTQMLATGTARYGLRNNHNELLLATFTPALHRGAKLSATETF